MLGYKCTRIAGDEESPFIFYLSGASMYGDGVTFNSIIETRRKHLEAYNTVELSYSDFIAWRRKNGPVKQTGDSLLKQISGAEGWDAEQVKQYISNRLN